MGGGSIRKFYFMGAGGEKKQCLPHIFKNGTALSTEEHFDIFPYVLYSQLYEPVLYLDFLGVVFNKCEDNVVFACNIPFKLSFFTMI